MASTAGATPPGRYQPLNFNGQEIRLMTIDPAALPDEPVACQTLTTELAQAPAYQALSYLWGDPADTKDITLNGVVTTVTKNLHAALLELRARQARTGPGGGGQAAPPSSDDAGTGSSAASAAWPPFFWIDAVCIDQNSTKEKNHQVPLMGAIYGRAVYVLVWLGPPDNESVAALDFIRRWEQAIDSALKDQVEAGGNGIDFSRDTLKAILDKGHMAELFDLGGFKAAGKLFDRPYWGRIWVVQEIVLAQKVLILNARPARPHAAALRAPADHDESSEDLDYSQLQRAVEIWGNMDRLRVEDLLNPMLLVEIDAAYRSPEGSTTGHQHVSAMEAIHNLRLARIKSRATGKALPSTEVDPLVVARKVRHSQATDPRDKIYGTYGLLDAGGTSGQQLPLQPDYALSVEETYLQFAAAVIASSGRLTVLRLGGVGSYDVAAKPAAALPSWVPDFSVRLALNDLINMEGVQHRADRGAVPAWHLTSDKRRLTVRGVLCDEITALSPSGHGTKDIWTWYNFAAANVQKASPAQANGVDDAIDSDAYPPGGIPWRQAFFRTVIADPVTEGYGPSGFSSAYHEKWFNDRAEGFFAFMRLTTLFAESDRIGRYEAETGLKVRWIVRPIREEGQDFDPDEWQSIVMDVALLPDHASIKPEVLYWLRNSFDNSDVKTRTAALDAFIGVPGAKNRISWPWVDSKYPLCLANRSSANLVLFQSWGMKMGTGRAFAITRRSYFGLVPGGAQVGDVVCVLCGSDVPLVLRPVPGGGGRDFVAVGVAYVCGMMQGEMIEEVGKGRLVVEDLTLV